MMNSREYPASWMKAFTAFATILFAFVAGSAAAQQPKAAGKEPVKMRITISTHPLLDFSLPVFVGMEKGLFEKEGVQIAEVISSEGGGTTVRNILTGGLDMGLVSFPAAVQANIAGAPLTVVEGGARLVTSHTLVVAENSKINSLKEAVNQGAAIGFSSPGSVTQALLFLNLQKMGIDPAKVNTRPTGGLGGGFTQVRGGGLPVTSAIEPVLSIAGKGLRVIHKHTDHVSKFQQMAWVVNPQFMKAHPEAVAGFLRARLAAINWIAANVDEAATIWSKRADSIPRSAALATLKTIIDAGGIKEYYGTGFDQPAMELAVESMRFLGTLKPDVVVPWKDFLDQSKLPSEAARVDVAKFANPKPTR